VYVYEHDPVPGTFLNGLKPHAYAARTALARERTALPFVVYVDAHEDMYERDSGRLSRNRRRNGR